jgi:hypothetical protein
VRGLIFALALTSGCAHWEPVAYRYPHLDLALVCADEYTIDQVCRAGGTKSDHGHTIPKGYAWTDQNGVIHYEDTLVPACFRSQGREIWMKWGPWCDTMSHELAHAEGLDPAYVEDNYPRKNQ